MYSFRKWWNRRTVRSVRTSEARLRIDLLEDRIAPATDVVATLTGGAVAFSSPGFSDDSLVLSMDSKGNLRHNLFSQKVPGFASDLDLDSATPGVQAMRVAKLTNISVDLGSGADRILVHSLGKSPLEFHLNSVESVELRTGTGRDVVALGTHDGHLDVAFNRKEFHIAGATEFVLDAQAGWDRVTVGSFLGATVPDHIEVRNAEIVTLQTGDGDDMVALSQHAGHLDAAANGRDFHVVGAREFVLDTQGGSNSVVVEDLTGAKTLREIEILGASTVAFQTGDTNDRVTIGSHGRHLDVAHGTRTFHVVGAADVSFNTGLGNDTVIVKDLSSVSGLTNLSLLNANSVVVHGSSRDDQIEIGAHNGHLDVDLVNREYHLLNAQFVTVDTGAGNDFIVVSDLTSIGAPNLTLKGGRGSDICRVLQGAGLVTIQDSIGINTLDFSGFSSAGVLVNLASLNTAQIIGGGVTLWLSSPLFNVIGTDQNDVIIGNSRNNLIDGRGGDDTLIGGGGNDILIGGLGNDQLFGGMGDDILIGGSGTNLLDGGPGSNISIN